jgi:predicted amidohydrolase
MERLVCAVVQLTVKAGETRDQAAARVIAAAAGAAAGGAVLCVLPRLDPIVGDSPDAVTSVTTAAAGKAGLWVVAAGARGVVVATPQGQLRPVPPGGIEPASVAGLALGLLPGRGAWSPEMARILSLRGAELLVAPVAVPAPYGEWEQLAGPWQVAQANQVFLAEAGLCGVAPGGASYASRAAILGPCEITPGATGFLARSDGPGDKVVLAPLDLEALTGVWKSYPIFNEFNYGLYERQLGAYYAGPARGTGGWTS